MNFNSYKKRYQFQTRNVISDFALSRRMFQLDRVNILSVMEILKGDAIKHSFYASKIRSCVASILDASNIIYLYGNPRGLRKAISNHMNRFVHGNATYFTSWIYRTNIAHSDTIFDGNAEHPESPRYKLGWKMNGFNQFLLSKLFGSTKGIKLHKLYADYRKRFGNNINEQTLVGMMNEFHEYVKDTEMFLLKKEYVSPFPKTSSFTFIQIKDM